MPKQSDASSAVSCIQHANRKSVPVNFSLLGLPFIHAGQVSIIFLLEIDDYCCHISITLSLNPLSGKKKVKS